MARTTRPDRHRRARGRRRPREGCRSRCVKTTQVNYEVALSVPDALEGERRFGHREGRSAEGHSKEEGEGERRKCMGRDGGVEGVGPPKHREWGSWFYLSTLKVFLG